MIGFLPAPLADRIRLVAAGRLERVLRRSDAQRGAAIVMHAVAPAAGDPDREIEPALDTARLDAFARYLSRRYALVRAAELPAATRSRAPGERIPVALTFDDDLPSHAEHAAPVLARHGAVATAFLCGAEEPFWWQLLQTAIDTAAIQPDSLAPVPPGLVGAALERRPRAVKDLARHIEELEPGERRELAARLRGVVDEAPRVLGADGAASLAAAGWELGFHTAGHDLLTALDDAALGVAVAPRPLGGGINPRTLAYPHGKATEREAAAARRAGYVAAYTGSPGVVSEVSDDHLTGRLQPDTGTLGRFALDLARSLSAGSTSTP